MDHFPSGAINNNNNHNATHFGATNRRAQGVPLDPALAMHLFSHFAENDESTLTDAAKLLTQGPSTVQGALNDLYSGGTAPRDMSLAEEQKSQSLAKDDFMRGCLLWCSGLLAKYPPDKHFFGCIGASAEWPSVFLRQILQHQGLAHLVVNIPISAVNEMVTHMTGSKAVTDPKREGKRTELANKPFVLSLVKQCLGDPAQWEGKTCVLLDVSSSGDALRVLHVAIENVLGCDVIELDMNGFKPDLDDANPAFKKSKRKNATLAAMFSAQVKSPAWKEKYERVMPKVDVRQLEAHPELSHVGNADEGMAGVMARVASLLDDEAHASFSQQSGAMATDNNNNNNVSSRLSSTRRSKEEEEDGTKKEDPSNTKT